MHKSTIVIRYRKKILKLINRIKKKKLFHLDCTINTNAPSTSEFIFFV